MPRPRHPSGSPRRVLLLLPTSSYKTADFMEAAGRLGVEVVVGTDRRQALEDVAPGHTLTYRLSDPAAGLRAIRAAHAERPFHAVVGADDETAVLAARAAAMLGLAHNPVEAVRISRDKHRTRLRLAAAGLPGPRFRRVASASPPARGAGAIGYPCVIKPLHLSASQGVLRVDDPRAFAAAFERVAAIAADPRNRDKDGSACHLLIEAFVPGEEVSLEGLLESGRLRELALFDKPDPLDGPTFPETLFVTPSRKPARVRERIRRAAAAACRALGLSEGPVHVELRVERAEPVVLEVAARTIGGLCARTLRFGAGLSLEELVLRHALGLDTAGLALARGAAGVLMLNVPRAGVLRRVTGVERARSVPGVVAVTLTLHRGAEVLPLPEGNRYLGFVFARGRSPRAVEAALREAGGALDIDID